jgi:hypothetical protein
MLPAKSSFASKSEFEGEKPRIRLSFLIEASGKSGNRSGFERRGNYAIQFQC